MILKITLILLVSIFFINSQIDSKDSIDSTKNNTLDNKPLTNINELDKLLPKNHLKEINDINELHKYLEIQKKCLIEIYSPTCPHCVQFAPKYEILSEIYLNKVEFIKINGSDSRNYRQLVKIYNFPSIFLYDDQKLFEYRGKLEINDLHEFIENVYFFKCNPIENEQSLINFIKDNSKTSYVLGVFNKAENVDIFHKLNEFNSNLRMIVENCFYFINKNTRLKTNNELPNIFNIGREDNLIVAYNGNKFSFFTEISILLKQTNDPMFFFMHEEIKLKYLNFINMNLFPVYEVWEESSVNNFLSRDKQLLIFSHKNEEEKLLMENLIYKFHLYRNDELDFLIILLDINTIDKSYWGYFAFSKQSGISTTDTRFDSIQGIYDSKYFDLNNLLMFLNDSKYVKKKRNALSNMNKVANLDFTGNNIDSSGLGGIIEQKVSYVAAKIVDNLKDVLKENQMNQMDLMNQMNQTNISMSNYTYPIAEYSNTTLPYNLNSNNISNATVDNISNGNHTVKNSYTHDKNKSIFIKYLIYLSVYSIIFYIFCKKYPNSPMDETKEI